MADKYTKQGGALINHDTVEYQNALMRRDKRRKEKKQQEIIEMLVKEVENLKNRVQELENDR